MIGFIIIAAALAAMTIFAVVAPLWRAREDTGAVDTDIDIYREQLSEVDRDLARGVLDQTEAERTRIEISRRLLAADDSARKAAREAPPLLSKVMAIVTAAALIGAAGWLYVDLGAPGYGDVSRAERIAAGEQRRAARPAQIETEAAVMVPDTLAPFDDATRELIQTRRRTVFEQPRNADVWAVLSQTEAAIGQFPRATRAQESLIHALGADAGIEDYERLADLMVASTQGYVSPEAEVVALALLQENPDNIAGLYYLGLMYAQNDRPDRAFNLWRRVIDEGRPGTLHWDFAAGQIEAVALQLGTDYVLPERRGPSAADLEAARDMPAEDRRMMIEGMVAQLSDRLANEGGPPQDWARLVSSLVILGEQDNARAILAEAELVFGGDVQAVTMIRRAAADAGLSE